uniref:Uncharacterized protein n=1 Tax=Lepeophtheirus salmonis TaxID=72036 RepID=A0A0K2TRL8_LEPSM
MPYACVNPGCNGDQRRKEMPPQVTTHRIQSEGANGLLLSRNYETIRIIVNIKKKLQLCLRLIFDLMTYESKDSNSRRKKKERVKKPRYLSVLKKIILLFPHLRRKNSFT